MCENPQEKTTTGQCLGHFLPWRFAGDDEIWDGMRRAPSSGRKMQE